MTNFRELCAELVEELAAETSLYPGHERGIVTRARAALAEPEPEGPTLDEVDDLCAEHSFCYEDSESLECLLLIITDALTRWGNNQGMLTSSTPQPIPVTERLPGDQLCWWFEDDEECGYGSSWTLLRIRGCTTAFTHWLPANALPQPS